MDYAGMKVLIMGLGLHGGGLESARFLLKRGADVTVTDLRDEQTLAPSIERLEKAPGQASVRYVLGKHEIDDFKNADMVIKNPGVRPDSPFFQFARRIETDISLFLDAITAMDGVRLTAVTGSKGKSSTASALHWVLAHSGGKGTAGKAYLGGNITVSPLAFLDDLRPGDDVTLELSSWQLGDLRGRRNAGGNPLLKPKAAVLTPIMPDHLDRYGTMDAYVADKRVIYQGQDSGDFTVAGDDDWGRSFLAESKAAPLVYSAAPLPKEVGGGWLKGTDGPGLARFGGKEPVEIVPAQPLVPGRHQKLNLLAAGLALLGLKLPPETINAGLGPFPGIEHRLERFHEARGIAFYNDSAATIPEAAAAALEALSSNNGRLILITGGTDKNLDFSPLVQAIRRARTVNPLAIILLAGTGSDKLRALLAADADIPFFGPLNRLDAAVAAALKVAKPGDRILLSPGCASFGMFLNEFDRGRKWKEAVKNATEYLPERTQSIKREGRRQPRRR
jgi:UDP-N-acetylmuramoylalanine--D-glutamate ligase